MKHLILKVKPATNISLLEIFEPQAFDGKISYPVRINGLNMMFEKSDIAGWTTKGMAFSFEPEIIQYIIEIIENHIK
jgi:hypothetical protein